MSIHQRLSILILLLTLMSCALGPPMNLAKGRYSSFQELERDANYQCQTKYGSQAKAMRLAPDSWDTEKFVCIKQ